MQCALNCFSCSACSIVLRFNLACVVAWSAFLIAADCRMFCLLTCLATKLSLRISGEIVQICRSPQPQGMHTLEHLPIAHYHFNCIIKILIAYDCEKVAYDWVKKSLGHKRSTQAYNRNRNGIRALVAGLPNYSWHARDPATHMDFRFAHKYIYIYIYIHVYSCACRRPSPKDEHYQATSRNSNFADGFQISNYAGQQYQERKPRTNRDWAQTNLM